MVQKINVQKISVKKNVSKTILDPKNLSTKIFGRMNLAQNNCKTPTQPNSTQLQPNITVVGLDMKMTLHTPPLITQTQCQQYLSWY